MDDVQVVESSLQGELDGLVTGQVTRIENNIAYVDFGGKSEGTISLREASPLRLKEITQILHVGQVVQAVVLGYESDEATQLSRRLAGARMWEQLREKQENDEVFEVVVHDVVNGGLVTDVGVRGFIPASLIDVQRVDDLERFRGETIPVKVIEVDEASNKLVLSRKVVLQDEARKAGHTKMDALAVGSIVEGTVRRVVDFGAFVDIGGVEGLVHVSEISWERVKHPSDVVTAGELVKVRILKVDPEHNRLSLSIRQAQEDPWTQAAAQLQDGTVMKGTVTRIVDFGAFIEVLPGIEGLVHISELTNHRVNRVSDVVQPNQSVEVKVLSVDVAKKRLSLSMKSETNDEAAPTEVEKFIESEKTHPGTGATLGDLFGDLLNKLK